MTLPARMFLLSMTLARGILRPDALNLGLDVTAQNEVVGADGRAIANVVALGPPTRGVFWEITAVPDIRQDCARVAKNLLASVAALVTE